MKTQGGAAVRVWKDLTVGRVRSAPVGYLDGVESVVRLWRRAGLRKQALHAIESWWRPSVVAAGITTQQATSLLAACVFSPVGVTHDDYARLCVSFLEDSRPKSGPLA